MKRVPWWLTAAALAISAAAVVRAAVGPQAGADGTYNLTTPRIDKTGALVITGYGGEYGEASLRQLTFAACDQGSGTAPPQTLSTTAIVVLYNPSGNNQRFRVQSVGLAYVSGTLSSGPVYHACIKSTTQTAPSGGTLLTNTCLDIGSGAVGTGVVRVGATVASGVVAIRPMCYLAPMLATSVEAITLSKEDVRGEFVVEPGATYQLQSVQAGAGTSPLVSPSITWTEEPIK